MAEQTVLTYMQESHLLVDQANMNKPMRAMIIEGLLQYHAAEHMLIKQMM